MNVSKVSMMSPMVFKAQTTIKAPESLLSKEDRDYFESVGSEIGKPTDTINITISDLHDTKRNPNVKTYTATKEYHFEQPTRLNSIKSNIEVPYIKNGEVVEKNSPKNYIANALKKLIQSE